MNIAQYVQGRDNNYTLLRHLAAAMVIFTHSHGLTAHAEPLVRLTGLSYSYIAVNIFFVLSGFLVTASWICNPDVRRYVTARILRIYPALWISVALCLFVVGPIFTTLPLRYYFLQRDFFIFAAENSTLLLKGVYHHLPGVFSDSAIRSVNESLWTLPIELMMYIGVLILGLSRVFRYPAIMIGVYVTLTLYYLAGVIFGLVEISDKEMVRLAGYFAGGSLYYLYRDRIPLSYIAMAVMVSLVFLGYLYSENLGNAFLTCFLPYVVFVFAYLPSGAVRQFNRLGDYSYGLYIYAFPIQQIIVTLGVHDVYVHVVLSYVVTLIVAAISWHSVESPALKIAKKELP